MDLTLALVVLLVLGVVAVGVAALVLLAKLFTSPHPAKT